MKHVFAAIGVAGILVASGAIFAHPASALSSDEIQEQIKALLAKVAELTAQLESLRAQADASVSSSTAVSASMPARICSVFAERNLAEGARGDDVVSLQEFLRSQGYLGANATGYYGPLTAQAVLRWQQAEGVDAVGIFGPLSRARIAAWCGNGGGGYSSGDLSAAPQSGTAPLTVTFTADVSLSNSQFIADAGSYKIVFGDGSEYVLPCAGSQATCPGPHTVAHTYSSAGTYGAQLVHFGYFGIANPDGSAPTSVRGSARIVVSGGGYACTEEYAPVCGSKQVQCIKAPCNPVQQTYGNRCQLNADGATYLYQGACKSDDSDPAADSRCRAWYDGCNNCSRSEPGGPAACTMRACVWNAPAYCTAYFDDDSSGNRSPSISSFSGPTVLSVNQTGTWTIQANDPENGSLTYRIQWGDEARSPYASAAAGVGTDSFVQMTSFTHAYASAGTYAVAIEVRDASGATAKASATVRVDASYSACTGEYAPVCGRPRGCANTCPPGMYCTAVCRLYDPVTYSNRCNLNASDADYLHDGSCTGSEQAY